MHIDEKEISSSILFIIRFDKTIVSASKGTTRTNKTTNISKKHILLHRKTIVLKKYVHYFVIIPVSEIIRSGTNKKVVKNPKDIIFTTVRNFFSLQVTFRCKLRAVKSILIYYSKPTMSETETTLGGQISCR